MILPTFGLMLAATAVQEAPATTPAPGRPPGAQRICRNVERLGTILPTRICRPASYWARIDQEQGRITDRDTMHMRNNSRTSMRGEHAN